MTLQSLIYFFIAMFCFAWIIRIFFKTMITQHEVHGHGEMSSARYYQIKARYLVGAAWASFVMAGSVIAGAGIFLIISLSAS